MSGNGTNTLPLTGLRIVEFAGIGPAPFAAMMLADAGAEVIRIDRIGSAPEPRDYTLRGRKSVALNLKDPGAIDVALRLIKHADGLIEGFRPGVIERLGLGPDTCLAANPRLVYGRMTGWGQDGPLARSAGHDLNYIALTGALWATGEAERPPAFAMNLLGDFGGGGMYLAFGMLAAILRARAMGQGDVVDAAICDGTNSLMTFIQARRAMGLWQDARSANHLDGGTPWYGVYECADGQWISIAAIEPQFWTCLLELLQLGEVGDRSDRSTWDATRAQLRDTFLGHPRAHWDALLAGTDACYAPVLSPAEAASHPHMAARAAFLSDGKDQPAAAPRFQSASTNTPTPPRPPGADTRALLVQTGLSHTEVDRLISCGVIAAASTQDETA